MFVVVLVEKAKPDENKWMVIIINNVPEVNSVYHVTF